MPTCQARYIQKLVDEAMQRSAVPWWLDTVCIPPREEDSALRTAAIENMQQIYAKAAKVLVLDSNLLGISKQVNPIELYLRLKMSSWMRRLWTLQEAILSDDVTIQFMDGSCSLREIAAAVQEEGDRASRNLYTRYNFEAGINLRALLEKNKVSQGRPLQQILRLLQWRSASRAGDEAVCLTNIAGFEPGPILSIPENNLEGRMVKFLQMLHIIPLVLIYQPPPRLSIPGFRWAPTSFLNVYRNEPTDFFAILPGEGKIAPNGEGLVLTGRGFSVRSTDDQPFTTRAGFLVEMKSKIRKFRYWYDQDLQAIGTHQVLTLERPALIELTDKWDQHLYILVNVVEGNGAENLLSAIFIALVGLLPTPIGNSCEGQPRFVTDSEFDEKQRWLLM